MHKRMKILLPLLLAWMLLLAACGGEQPSANPTDSGTPAESTAPAESAAPSDSPAGGDTLETTDARGNPLTLTRNPQRIIVIDPAMCDILYAIGAQEQIVAVGSYCEHPEEVASKPKVGAYDSLNVEELVALTPNLILFGTMSTDEAKVEALTQAGIEVAVFPGDTIQDAYFCIKTLGELTGKTTQAQSVEDDMRASLKAISDLGVQQTEKPTVYIEISPLDSGLYSCGAGTFQNELTAMAGGRNIFADQDGWIAVSEEQVIQLNPDVIISTTQYDGYDPTNEIPSRAGWENLSAVQNGRVYYMDPTLFALASPRLVVGAETAYALLYPAE